jgi:membrane protein YqaA with SNARE-associated domain
MRRFIAWLQAFALGIGGPGLLLVAFLDSSFLTLPQIPDVLLVWLVVEHPHRLVYYAAMTTIGSVAGCFVIYYLAFKGGEAFLRGRVHERHVDRGIALFDRYGIWALIVPSMLPPPAPFKIFVLLAGVAGMSRLRFLGAVAFGRTIRYFGEALLALWYGRTVIDFLHQNLRPVAWVVTGFLGLAVAWWIWKSRRATTEP